ncbi:MerC domain-containing protein [Parasphingorhabdus sp.]|uniref:MerC domain-containing protein n=1 Tax=Parasphingorhabdus sp. TaxID=2709688 RepID=UPI0032655C7A
MFTATKLWNKDGLLIRDGLWDRLAVLLSGLCLVHCISTIAIVAILSSTGGMLFDPLIHEIGLGIAIAIGLFSLGRGVMDHGYIMPVAIGSLGLGMMIGAISIGHDSGHGSEEVLSTMIGVGLLALAHDLNYRATH